MVGTRIGTLLVLGADGDLTRRLLLPGLAALLGSDSAPRRPLLLLGAGLGELDERAWQQRVTEAFGAGGKGGRGPDTARTSRYRTCDVTSVEELRGLLAECEGTPAI